MAVVPAHAQPDQQEPIFDTHSALLWIFRYKALYSPLEPAVYCDEQKIARMDNGRYFLFTVEPGVHTIRSTDETRAVTMSFEAGREYFLEVEVSEAMTMGILKFKVGRASRFRGLEALTDLKPLKPGDIVDKKRVTSATYEDAKRQAS